MAATSTRAVEQPDGAGRQHKSELYRENFVLEQNHLKYALTNLYVLNGGHVVSLGMGYPARVMSDLLGPKGREIAIDPDAEKIKVPGYTAAVLSDLVGPEGKVVAFQEDAESLKTAAEKNSRPNIQYLVANGPESIPGDGYNVIVSLDRMHLIADKETLLKQLFTKLANRGQFGFMTFNGLPKLPHVFSKGMHDLISPDFEDKVYKALKFEDSDTYKSLAKEAGLNASLMIIYPWSIWFEGTDQFLGFLAGITHGGFSVESVEKEKLMKFKAEHEVKIKTTPLKVDVLSMVLSKTGPV